MAGPFTMVAIYAAKVGISEKRLDYSMLSCLALGLAASFKLFALALLPIFAFFLSRQSVKHWLLEIIARAFSAPSGCTLFVEAIS